MYIGIQSGMDAIKEYGMKDYTMDGGSHLLNACILLPWVGGIGYFMWRNVACIESPKSYRQKRGSRCQLASAVTDP